MDYTPTCALVLKRCHRKRLASYSLLDVFPPDWTGNRKVGANAQRVSGDCGRTAAIAQILNEQLAGRFASAVDVT